ncbi:MAG: hypothetical protein R3F20_13995 [Planctomycetota bacterium]
MGSGEPPLPDPGGAIWIDEWVAPIDHDVDRIRCTDRNVELKVLADSSKEIDKEEADLVFAANKKRRDAGAPYTTYKISRGEKLVAGFAPLGGADLSGSYGEVHNLHDKDGAEVTHSADAYEIFSFVFAAILSYPCCAKSARLEWYVKDKAKKEFSPDPPNPPSEIAKAKAAGVKLDELKAMKEWMHGITHTSEPKPPPVGVKVSPESAICRKVAIDHASESRLRAAPPINPETTVVVRKPLTDKVVGKQWKVVGIVEFSDTEKVVKTKIVTVREGGKLAVSDG